jgi:mono/diheme cytochrome c family protein
VIESGGGGMPAFREMLTEQEKTDLIAYLRTL